MNRSQQLFPFLLLVFFFYISGLQAQEISFSLKTKDKGRLSADGSIWVMHKGDTLPMLVKYGQQQAMNYPKGYIFIDRRNHLGVYEEYANKKTWVELAKTSVATTIDFIEDGHYLVSYANHKKEIMVTDSLYIQYDKSVFFCKDIDIYAQPIDIKQEFQSTEGGLYNYYMILKSYEVFDTHKFQIKIYQYNYGDYRTPISEYWEYVNHEWKHIAYKGAFLKPGQYRMEIFKANGEPFATGYFKLLPKEDARSDSN